MQSVLIYLFIFGRFPFSNLVIDGLKDVKCPLWLVNYWHCSLLNVELEFNPQGELFW